MNREYLIIALIVLSFVMLAGLWWWQMSDGENLAHLQSEAHWRAVIEDGGAREAHQQFEKYTSGYGLLERHEIAHAFGGALFSAQGLEAFVACTYGNPAHTSYGCFHEFIGRAVSERGIAAIETLSDTCRSETRDPILWLGCQHGIGHGVQTHYGYDEEALEKTLAVCDTLEQADDVGGCYGGAFMEYNLRTMLGADALVRPSTEGVDADALCQRLDVRYRTACLFRLPEWWRSALFAQQVADDVYTALAQRCHAIDDDATQMLACIGGIGDIMPREITDPQRAGALCSDAVGENAEHDYYCRIFAARRFAQTGTPDAERVCRGLPNPYAAQCTMHMAEYSAIFNVSQ